MSEEEFSALAAEEWANVPAHFQRKIDNVALLIEDEPSEAVREEEGLEAGETLLGLYQGIPNTARGSEYGVGATLPDTITLYRLPLIEEAEHMDREFRQAMRIAIRETLWHELAHYFGYPEEPINEREREGTNQFE